MRIKQRLQQIDISFSIFLLNSPFFGEFFLTKSKGGKYV